MTTAEVVEPTKEDFLEEVLESVHREADDSWRHGCYIYQVFHRKEDDTYWAVNYNLSSDGETNGLREGDYDIDQVERVEKTITTVAYETIAKPESSA